MMLPVECPELGRTNACDTSECATCTIVRMCIEEHHEAERALCALVRDNQSVYDEGYSNGWQKASIEADDKFEPQLHDLKAQLVTVTSSLFSSERARAEDAIDHRGDMKLAQSQLAAVTAERDELLKRSFAKPGTPIPCAQKEYEEDFDKCWDEAQKEADRG